MTGDAREVNITNNRATCNLKRRKQVIIGGCDDIPIKSRNHTVPSGVVTTFFLADSHVLTLMVLSRYFTIFLRSQSCKKYVCRMQLNCSVRFVFQPHCKEEEKQRERERYPK